MTVANMSKKTRTDEMPKMISTIEKIVDKHKHEKGLIHTFNYEIRDAIMTINDDRLITHNTNDRQEQIDKFKESDKPLVMVSPSMERGVSLNDDLARFIISARTPYLFLGDEKVKARLYKSGRIGEYWYKSNAAQTLEQQVGRGVRSEDDYCEIYLLDSQIEKLISKNTKLFSQHFKDCVVLQ